MLNAVTGIAVFGHYGYTTSRQRYIKCSVAETVILTSKTKTRVTEETKSIYGLLKACSIVIMLCKSFSTILVDIHSECIEKIFINYIGVDHRLFNFFFYPMGHLRYILTNTSSHVAERFSKLLSCPHISVAKEKLGSH